MCSHLELTRLPARSVLLIALDQSKSRTCTLFTLSTHSLCPSHLPSHPRHCAAPHRFRLQRIHSARLGLERLHPHPDGLPPLLLANPAHLARKIRPPLGRHSRQSRPILLVPVAPPGSLLTIGACLCLSQFEVGSIICGASQNVDQLIGGRALSGVGAAGVSRSVSPACSVQLPC